jgi:hypothetical protein
VDEEAAGRIVRSEKNQKAGGNPFSTDQEVNIDFPEETLKMIKGVSGTGVKTIVAMNLNGSLVFLPKRLRDIPNAGLMVFDVWTTHCWM